MNEFDQPSFRAMDEVEDLLDAYAGARLAPAGPVLSRMRRALVAQATAAAAARANAGVVERPRARFALPNLHVPRRAFALGLAASLTLGTSAAVLAAPPGSPFYNARLVLEVALMPPVTNLEGRLAAYEQQFEQRLKEAEAAIARGDSSGLAAALAAYQQEVTNAVAELGESAVQLDHFEDVLAKHIAKLEALAVKLPTEVARENAVEHAIQASEKAVEKIKEKQQAHENQGSPQRPSTPPGQPSGPPNRP